MTHLNPVLELNLSAGINTDVLERLPNTVIRLSSRLQGLEDRGFVNSPRRVCVNRTIRFTPVSSGEVGGQKEKMRTDLKRLMRSNISSWVTSGYFFCSRMACILREEEGDGGWGTGRSSNCVRLQILYAT